MNPGTEYTDLQSLQNQIKLSEVLSKLYKWNQIKSTSKKSLLFECPRQLEQVRIFMNDDGTEGFCHLHTNSGGRAFALARFLSGKPFGKGVRCDMDDVKKCREWLEELK